MTEEDRIAFETYLKIKQLKKKHMDMYHIAIELELGLEYLYSVMNYFDCEITE